MKSRAGLAAAIFTAVSIILSGCSALPATPEPSETLPPQVAATSLTALTTIPIKGRAPKTGYSRQQFGPAWKDVDHTGCNTRNRVLGRTLESPIFKPGKKRCVVLSGILHDPYTGKTINFTRGPNSSLIQIDHVVPLSDAWQKGAQSWDQTTREKFANDLENLVPVDGQTNMKKSDGDLATWLPPNRSYWCTYTQKIITIKAKYGLWMTSAEHQRAEQIITKCST